MAAERRAARRGEAEEEVDVVRGGETRRLRVRASRSADGLVLTFDDITRLVAAQRNAAWRDVARRIAHEIKNPLTPIQLSAERLRRKYRKDDRAATSRPSTAAPTPSSARWATSAGWSTSSPPSPACRRRSSPSTTPPSCCARRCSPSGWPSPDIDVELDRADRRASRVLATGACVGQALTNVLKNAGEAIARAGAARRAEGPHPRAPGRPTTTGVAFEVEDNGVGLPAKDRDRLTEPYVTTREKGTGLGLAIVKRILEDHGGELELTDAREGAGRARRSCAFPARRGRSPRRDPQP